MNKILKETVKHYTQIVGFEIAKKLKDAGYPQNIGREWYNAIGVLIRALPMREDEVAAPTYAEVFDWFMDKGYAISVTYFDLNSFCGYLVTLKLKDSDYATEPCDSWHEAADSAIEVALEMIKKD